MIRSITFLSALLAVFLASSLLAEVTEVDNATLEQMRKEGAVIIDVRRQDEWEATGLVEGSHPLTFFDAKGRYDAKAWLSELDRLVQPDQPVILICARGVRSAKIAGLLDKRLGYTHVHNVTRGISAWLAEKRPVEAFEP